MLFLSQDQILLLTRFFNTQPLKFNIMSKRLFFLIAVIVLAACLQGQTGFSQDKQNILRAGVAKIDITPEFPVMLYGYASRKTLSEGVHDRLSARAIVFENGGKKVVMVSSDLGSYSDSIYRVFRRSIMDKYNLNESELFLSTIHSHSSPSLTLSNNEADISNKKYTKDLNQKLLTLIGEAISGLKPVRTATGAGYSPVGSNRREMRADGSITLGRNPYGPTDKEVLVMKVTEEDGTTVAAVFDYATHSTSLGPANMLISGDVLGLSAQFVEKYLGDEAVTPVFAGASGDIDPWYRILPGFNTERGWIPEPVLLGTLLGEEVVHIFENIKEVKPGGKISTSITTLECPAKKNEKIDPADKPIVPVNITVVRIGDDVAFVGLNLEVFNEIGTAIKEGSPFKHTFIITHCNGSSGYLPTSQVYKEGGYEVTSTRFEIGSSDLVIKMVLRMLYDLK